MAIINGRTGGEILDGMTTDDTITAGAGKDLIDGTTVRYVYMKFLRNADGNTFMIPGGGATRPDPTAFRVLLDNINANGTSIESFEVSGKHR